MSDKNSQLAYGGAAFTVELLEKLKVATAKTNIILSPFSIQTCLALVYAGANGVTAEEIAKAMKYGSNCTSDVAAAFKSILENYKNSDLLKIANKLYVPAGKSIKTQYANIVKEEYMAEVESINFAESQEATKTINAWVEDRTAGKITQLIPDGILDDSTRLLLSNVLYFKGEWQWKFKEQQSEEDDFWIGAEETVKLMYMQQKGKFNFGDFTEYNCSALEMPYTNCDLSMFVLLPDEREGLKELVEKLKGVNLLELSKKMQNREVIVKFPKFKIDYSVELTDVLKELGISKAFDSSADFSNILESAEDLYISQVLHKASIEVNEEGSEAAAATGVQMYLRCARRGLEFEADHPFLYWIWNKENILFAGAFVNAPTVATD